MLEYLKRKRQEKMEDYVDQRYREEAWKFWEDDERVSGSGWMIGMAIIIYRQNRPEKEEGFRQDYLKKVKISA